MYTIVMQDDKRLQVTRAIKIYQRETGADAIRFLIPPVYVEGKEQYNLAEFVIACKFTTPAGKVFCERLIPEEVLYDEKYLDCQLPVDADMTEQAGKVQMYLTFLNAVTNEDGTVSSVDFHTEDVYITISPKAELVYIPEESLQAVDKILLELDNKMDKLTAMTESLNTMRANDIELIDGEIYAVYKDPDTGEVTILGDPISGSSHVWEDM